MSPLEPQTSPLAEPTGGIPEAGGPQGFRPMNPLPFGGRTAEALGQFSQDATEAGKNIFGIVQQRQDFANEAEAQNNVTNYMKGATKLYYQYQNLQGEAAAKALPDFQNQLQQLWDQSVNSASNPQARLMMQKGARWYLERYFSMGEEHAAREHQQWLKDSADGAIEEAGNQAVLSMNDPHQMDLMLGLQASKVESYGQQIGWDDSRIQLEQSRKLGETVDNAIKLKGDEGDLAGAQALFEKYRGRMDAAHQVAAAQYLRPKLKSYTADGQLVSILGVDNAASIGLSVPGATAAESNGAPGLVSVGPSGFDNNVGNIKYNPRLQWEGMGQPHGAFNTFSTPQQGVAAAVKNLASYGNVSLSDAIYKWAPPSDNNDTEAYIKRFTDAGFNRDQPIPINDPDKMTKFMDIMSTHEKGHSYPQDVIRQGVEAAIEGKPLPQGPMPGTVWQGNQPMTPRGPAAWPAKEDAMRQAIAMTEGNPEGRATLLARLNNAYAVHEGLTATERKGAEEFMNSSIYAADNGGDISNVTPLSVDQMVAVGIEKGRAIALSEEFQIAQHASQVMQGLQLSSRADEDAAVRDLAAGTGIFEHLFYPHGRGKPTGGPGTVEGVPSQDETVMFARQRVFIAHKLQAMIDNKRAMLTGDKADPAAYAMGSPIVQQATKAMADIPVTDAESMAAAQGAFLHYVQQQKTVQTQMGVPENEQHVIPKDASINMAAELQRPGTDVKKKLDEWHARYGDGFSLVMHDLVTQGKLPAGYQMVDALDDPLAAFQLSTALQQGLTKEKAKKEIGDDAVSGKAVSAILPSIDKAAANPMSSLGTYIRSMRASGAPTDQIDGILDGIKLLALSKATISGVPQTKAVDDSIKAFTAHYEFLPGGARVPIPAWRATGQNIQFMTGPDHMNANTIAVPDEYGRPGMPGPEGYIEGIKAQPHWITHVMPDRSMALWLLDQKLRIVRTKDGQPFQIPISETPMPGAGTLTPYGAGAAAATPEQARRGVRGIPLPAAGAPGG